MDHLCARWRLGFVLLCFLGFLASCGSEAGTGESSDGGSDGDSSSSTTTRSSTTTVAKGGGNGLAVDVSELGGGGDAPEKCLEGLVPKLCMLPAPPGLEPAFHEAAASWDSSEGPLGFGYRGAVNTLGEYKYVVHFAVSSTEEFRRSSFDADCFHTESGSSQPTIRGQRGEYCFGRSSTETHQVVSWFDAAAGEGYTINILGTGPVEADIADVPLYPIDRLVETASQWELQAVRGPAASAEPALSVNEFFEDVVVAAIRNHDDAALAAMVPADSQLVQLRNSYELLDEGTLNDPPCTAADDGGYVCTYFGEPDAYLMVQMGVELDKDEWEVTSAYEITMD